MDSQKAEIDLLEFKLKVSKSESGRSKSVLMKVDGHSQNWTVVDSKNGPKKGPYDGLFYISGRSDKAF